MTPFKRRRRGGVVATFEAPEASVLANLAGQVIELLRDRNGEQVSDPDPLLGDLGMTGPSQPPEDPVLKRLLPDAYRDDPERKTLARLSVRRPEVLSVIPADEGADRDAAEIAFTVAEDGLEPGDLFALSATCAANVFEGGFRTADFPHARLEVGTYADARRLLRHPRFIKACRLANLRLMRAGQLHPHVAAAHNHRLVQAALSRFPVR